VFYVMRVCVCVCVCMYVSIASLHNISGLLRPIKDYACIEFDGKQGIGMKYKAIVITTNAVVLTTKSDTKKTDTHTQAEKKDTQTQTHARIYIRTHTHICTYQ